MNKSPIQKAKNPVFPILISIFSFVLIVFLISFSVLVMLDSENSSNISISNNFSNISENMKSQELSSIENSSESSESLSPSEASLQSLENLSSSVSSISENTPSSMESSENQISQSASITLSEFEILAGLSKPINQDLILKEVNDSRLNSFDYNSIGNDCFNFEYEFISIYEITSQDQPNTVPLIASVPCNAGAYNTNYEFFYYPQGFDNLTEFSKMNIYSLSSGSYQKIESTQPSLTTGLTNIFGFDYLRFESIFKSRGLGDCGVYSKYQIAPETKSIYEIESRSSQCDDENKLYQDWQINESVKI